VLGFHYSDLPGAGIFGLVVLLWVLEEGGRRLFMARQEFWKLVLNDAIYVVAAIGMLIVFRVTTGGLTLNLFLASMAVGSGVSFFAAAFVQLPFHEVRGGPVTAAAIKQVMVFATWRCAQSVARPMSIFVARVMVAGLVSSAALGRLEIARLLTAPVIVFIGGLGTYLLPRYAEQFKADSTRQGSREVIVPTVVLSVAVGAYGVASLVFAEQLSPLLTGGAFDLNRYALAGWFLFAIAFAGGLPSGNFLLARRLSRKVFEVRAIGSVIGLVLVAPMVMALGAVAVPYALAFGMFISNWWLWRLCLSPVPGRVEEGVHRD
jgi:O-antigen/teichoic acid export membrane protein